MLDTSAFNKLYVADKLFIAGDAIIKGTVTADKFQGNNFEGKQLCLDDLCITKQDLQDILNACILTISLR